MRIPSGKIDQSVYFVALDANDLATRKTGLTAFTVYRSRNGGAATVYTTPTVTELSAANMPGVYALLVDEDTTVASTSDSEEYCVHITCATMAPVSRTIELYRPADSVVLDRADSIETGLTVRQTLRGTASKLFGKVSGGSTGTETFRNAVADSANRLVFVDDVNGNRTAVTATL